MEPVAYARELHQQFGYLVTFARSVNELDLAASLFGEFRGMQDAGWSTTQTAYEAFEEIKALGAHQDPLSRAQFRQMLCLYTHLAEAGGVYESLANLMGVIQLKPYNLWPFQTLVRVKQTPSRVIGPNANATFRRLAELANSIGMTRLAELLELTFRDDIRNGIAHADYIIAHDGLRLRRRNGGNAYVVSHDQVTEAINIGLFFFDLLKQCQDEVAHSFRPAQTIIGRFSANPPMPHTVELKENGAFSISSSSPGPQTDAAFDRQEKVNNRLGGRVLMAYGAEALDDLRAAIQQLGFEVPLVVLDQSQLQNLDAEIEADDLWKPNAPRDGALRLATPAGFVRLDRIDQFEAELPQIDELEVL